MVKRRSTAALAVGLLLPVLTGCSLLHHGAKKVEAAPVAPVRLLKLDSTVYNLADPTPAYLRLGISVGVTNPDEKGDGTIESVARDTLVTLVTAQTSDALLTEAGKAALKKSVLEALQKRLPTDGIKTVYFDDFLIQH